jgi:hypothetical protein
MRMCGSGSTPKRIRLGGVRNAAALIVALTVICAAGAGSAQAAVPSCPQIAQFNAANFHNPTVISNKTFPLVPGTQLVLDGTVVRGGATVPHRVVFTVTDVTKVINGVRTLAIWDVDTEGPQVIEAELAFFAQDDAGNVWSLGEYPEEFLDGVFVGAPSVWLAGIKEAVAGIHMTPTPTVNPTFFLQGFAPDIEFEDCARVRRVGQQTCVPFNCFSNVVVTEERDQFDLASGVQTKFYAPGTGIVQIGAINDPMAETLALSNVVHLNAEQLENARLQVLTLDARAYQFSDIYGQTPRAERPPAPAPPRPAGSSAARCGPACATGASGASRASSRSTAPPGARSRRRAAAAASAARERCGGCPPAGCGIA